MGLMESIAAVEDVRKRSKRVNATFELESASARVSVEMALRPTSAMFTVRAAPHESRGYGPANDLVTALDQLAAAHDRWSYRRETLKVQGSAAPLKGKQLALLIDELLVAAF